MIQGAVDVALNVAAQVSQIVIALALTGIFIYLLATKRGGN